MKTYNSCLLATALSALTFATSTTLLGESFVGPTSGTNRLVIGSNESIIIDSVVNWALFDSRCGLLVSNATYQLDLPLYLADVKQNQFLISPFAISGPSELLISNACALHIVRLRNASIKTLICVGNRETNVFAIDVPPQKTVQFFHLFLNPPRLQISLRQNGYTNSLIVRPGDIIEGPATVVIQARNNPIWDDTVLGSYWIAEDVFENPNFAVIKGASTIQVEKSNDLKAWEPIATFSPPLGSNGFYRLKISK